MLQWFKKNPELYNRESQLLSADSNYKEIHQVANNLLVSHGCILIRLDKIYKFPILMVYSNATPYNLPLIFPLKEVLSEGEVNRLSGLSVAELTTEIKNFVCFYYNLRHQNSVGVLCILESDNLDTGSTFYSATSILKRVSEWFNGIVTGEFPPDNEEIEYTAHFKNVNLEIQYVYSDLFLDVNLTEGECYFTKFGLSKLHLYSGIFIDGKGKNGLFVNANVNFKDSNILHEALKSSYDFVEHPEIVKKLMAEEKILKAFWFEIENEPQPFETFVDLVTIIGNSSYDEGKGRLHNVCLSQLTHRPDNFILGLRFPNRKNNLEFQLFKIHRSINPPNAIPGLNPELQMDLIIRSYEKVEALRGERMTEETYHLRNSKRADREILKARGINVLGVGAIGSEVADCMSKTGIGFLGLIDNQFINAHNPVRHRVGLSHYGIPKVYALQEILAGHNPFIVIAPLFSDLFEIDYTSFDDNSISISCVADDNVEGYINERLVLLNKTAFYVRALRGGKVARIFRVIPGKDACFFCLSLYRTENREFIDIPDDLEYPTLRNECNNPIRPASAIDLKLIASLASGFLLNHLQEGKSEINHWIWSSESIENTPIEGPNRIYSQYIAPHPNCPYCINKQRSKVIIKKSTLEFMQDLISREPKIETGGVLIGTLNKDGDYVINSASESGPDAKRSETRFEKDISFCQEFIDNAFEKSNGEKLYMGEWHSHTSSKNEPSGIDIKSLTEIGAQENYLTEKPLMIILSNKGVPSCTIHPVGKIFYNAELIII